MRERLPPARRLEAIGHERARSRAVRYQMRSRGTRRKARSVGGNARRRATPGPRSPRRHGWSIG